MPAIGRRPRSSSSRFTFSSSSSTIFHGLRGMLICVSFGLVCITIAAVLLCMREEEEVSSHPREITPFPTKLVSALPQVFPIPPIPLSLSHRHTHTSLFLCHRQKLKEETICNSKPFLRGRNPRRKKHPNLCEINGVLKNFKHWVVVVIVVDPVMCGVQFQGAHRERLYWGTYRPNLYLGIRARFVNKTATTAIWPEPILSVVEWASRASSLASSLALRGSRAFFKSGAFVWFGSFAQDSKIIACWIDVAWAETRTRLLSAAYLWWIWWTCSLFFMGASWWHHIRSPGEPPAAPTV